MPGVYTSTEASNLRTKNFHLKCDVIDGSIVDGLRQPLLYSFVLDKPSGYGVFCEPETIHCREISKSVLNKKNIFLKDDNHEQVKYNRETLTFTVQMIKI